MNLKEVKRQYLVNTAIDLFMSRSINEVTIKDIANQAGVGEATIYRYFGKKENIVLEAVLQLQKIVNDNYFQLDKGKTGYEKMELFYNSYLDVFNDRPLFYKFIKEFDAFMNSEDPTALHEYGQELEKYQADFINAYQLGLQDKTLKPQKDIELFYFATTHAMMELCKKLAIGQIVVEQDIYSDRVNEIKYLINIILHSLKNS